MADEPQPRLLSIAPELRNRIWEYSLVSKTALDFCDPANRQQPALLKTCRQIRGEAMQVYYSQNKFKVVVCNYDVTKARSFHKLLKKYSGTAKTKNYNLTICKGHWHQCVDHWNLRNWLQAYHRDPSRTPALNQNFLEEKLQTQTLARRTFGAVRSMRNREWKDVNAVLGAFFDAIDLIGSCEEDWLREQTVMSDFIICENQDNIEDEDGEDDIGEALEDMTEGSEDMGEGEDKEEDREHLGEESDVGDKDVEGATKCGSDGE